MNIWLVRHGASESNDKKIFSKSLPLTSKGISQAEWLRSYFSDKQIQHLYTSSLDRAKHTADIIADSLAVEPIVACDLREVEYGELEGKPYSLAEQHYPELFSIDPKHILSIKYPGGETHMDVHDRVSSWLDRTSSLWKAEENIIIVTHALIAKIIITILLDCPPNFFIKFKISNGSISRVQVLAGIGYLVDFNKTSS